MRAAQNQRVNFVRQQRAQVFAHSQPRYFVFQPALFHQRHQQGCGLRQNARVGVARADGTGVGIAVYRGAGGNHADVAVARGRQRGLCARFNHAQHGHIARHLLHALIRHRRNRVTRNHQGFHLVLQQKINDLRGKSFNGGARFHAIGHARRVAKINDILVGQAFHQGADYG